MADDECLQLDDSQCAGQAAGAVAPVSSAAAVARGTAVAQQPALPLTAPPAHCAALAPTVPAATTTTSRSSSAAPTSTGVSAVALLIQQQQQQQQQQPLAVSRSSSLRLPSHPVVTALSLPPAVRAAAVQSASAAQQSASSVAARFANVAAAAPVAASAAAEPPQLPPSTSAILSLVAAAASAAANNNSNNNSNARASSVALPKGGRLTNEGRQFPGPLGLVRDGSEPITKRRREDGDMQENTLSVVEAEPVAASKSSSVGAAAAQDAVPAAAPSFDAAQPLSQDDLWVSSQWLRALQLLEAPPFGQRQLDHCIRWVLLEGWWRSCPLLVVAVTQLQALHHDATVELKDPTATMRAVIHRDVMEGPTGTQIEAGTVLVLRNVSVFSTSPTERFLNVVPETIVHLLSAASCADCSFAELPEAYQPSLIYSRIPTRLKRPSSGGDKAKKKDTPKPAKPNNSSNNSAKRSNNNNSSNNNNNNNKYQRNNGNNNNHNSNNSAYGGGRGRGTSAAPTNNKGRGSPLRANTKATSVSSSSSAIPSAFSGSNLRATQFFASAPPPASSAPVSTPFTTSSFLNGPPVVAPAPLLPHQTVSIPPAAAVAPVQPVAAAQAWEDDSIFADVDLDSIVAAAKKK